MTGIRRSISIVLAAAGLLFVVTTSGADVSAPIEELFSSTDGKLQFIQLVNVTPGQLAGMALTTSHDGVTQTFIFPADSQIPTPPRTPYLLIVSQSLSQRPIFGSGGGATEWDYVIPDGFLPLSGGTLSLGSLDQWDYGRVPADGYSALYRSGGIGVHRAHSSAHGIVVRLGDEDVRVVIEYATDSGDPRYDRHFFTSIEAEIAALESARIPVGPRPGWHRIYQDFGDYTGFAAFGRRVEVMSHPVCRFYLPPPSAYESHFFTASEAECSDVQARFPQLILETDNAFYAGLPDPITGTCATGLGPLYRLWNRTTNDHWFTADTNARTRAMTLGWVPEGYGADGVGMCVLLACGTPC